MVCLVLLFVAFLSLGAQESASAASGTISIPAIGVNAPIVKVGKTTGGGLAIGSSTHVVYAWRAGDPPCDATGTTLYAGHAWKSGNGVADHWGAIRKGNLIRVPGCRFKVTKVMLWSAHKSVKSLSRPDGPPQIALYGCKANDYSKRVVILARRIGKGPLRLPSR